MTPLLPTLPPDRHIDPGKAAFFEACGFSLIRCDELRNALLDHAATGRLTDAVVSPYGTRYIVRGGLHTPDGRQPLVCGVWQADHGAVGVRLITAYPD